METKYPLDCYSRPLLEVEQCVEAFLNGWNIDGVAIEDGQELVDYYEYHEQIIGQEPQLFEFLGTVQEFHCVRSNEWLLPDQYKELDVLRYVLDKCETQQQEDRVLEEGRLFVDRNMLNMLRWMKYFVDECKRNRIVIGVGRGSSVSSYILYLLGVHKIDSIAYELDINEFFK